MMETVVTWVIIIVVLYFGLLIWLDSLRRKNLEEKKNAYQDALAALRKNPTSPSLHEQALTLGRDYSAATRSGKGVTLFDETALANDIRAVTANATQTTTAPKTAPVTSPAQTMADRITALKKMKESGLLSDEEFEQKRKSILDSI